MQIINGDCLHVLRNMPDNSVDAVVTDPPYGLSNTSPDKVADTIVRWAQGDREYVPAGKGFMSQTWDAFVPPPAVWDECYRVLKPGGHMAVFAGTRTQDLMGLSIRLAGFTLRDSISWNFGSGFPKSHNVGKATGNPDHAGMGTALKPGHEPLIRAQKPFNVIPLDERLAASVHHALMGLLWLSLSTAKRAELISTSSRHEQHGETFDSALVNAVAAWSRDESAETDTFRSQGAASTSLSIASSWNSILDALSDSTRTYTTETKSSTTTALRTLNSSLGPITSQITTHRNDSPKPGEQSPAQNVGPSSNDDWGRFLHTLSASVPETAIDGIALAAASALADIAESLSVSPEAANTARPGATTRAGAKSGQEPIFLARKPLSEKTVGANVQKWGTGAINIDACRIASTDSQLAEKYASLQKNESRDNSVYGKDTRGRAGAEAHAQGRFPANVTLDPVAADALDQQTADLHATGNTAQSLDRINAAPNRSEDATGFRRGQINNYGDSGGASRFFHVAEPDAPFLYCAKAPKKERPAYEDADGQVIQHSTVKPLKLISWICRLIVPPGGTVLDPFAGSGTTVEAAILEGFNPVAIEAHGPYIRLIEQRAERAQGRLDVA